MAEQRPYFPFYPKDWLGSASVSAMPLAAQGLYARLLSFAWLSDGLPADEDALRRLASVERVEWKRVWPLVAPLWEERDGRLYQGKQERVRQEQTAYATAKSLAGQKGGRRSAEARTEVFGSPDPRSNREARHEAEREARGESGGEAVVKPSSASASASAKKKNPPTPKGERDPLFQRFYDAFPKKVAPDTAYAEWRKRKPDAALLQQMLDAVAWQTKHYDWGPHNEYTPRPSKWLREGRWKEPRPAGALNGTPLDYDYDTAPIGHLPKVEW
jgi:uncharacterized protein YdaU (DUF1376 family)